MSGVGDQHPADNMPGRALAAARAAQNLSVADAARQLRLTPAQVEALEAGDYDRLPGPVFVRGFMRNYARLLKMDPEHLLRSAGLDVPMPAAHEAAPPSQEIPFPGAAPRRWPWLLAATAAIVAALAIYEFYWNDTRPAVITTVTAPGATSVELAPAMPPAVVATEMPAEVRSATADDARQVPVSEQDGKQAGEVAAGGTAGAAVAPSASQDSKVAGTARIALVFEKESWVQIRDREGRTIFLRHNPPGTAQQVDGLPPFTLVIGNAHGVRLTYNDRPVDLSRHATDDVARLTLE